MRERVSVSDSFFLFPLCVCSDTNQLPFFHCVLFFPVFPFVVCYSTATGLVTDAGYYERHIGQTAVLKCVIENCIPGAKCHVQWIHSDYTIMTHETKGKGRSMDGTVRCSNIGQK